MKTILSVLMSLIVIFGYSQVVENGDFETWTQHGTSPNLYEQPGGTFLSTLNELVDLSPMIGGPGPVTCDKVAAAYQGSYAARVVSKQFHDIFLPGMIGTTELDIPKQTIYLGRPYTLKPYSFKGYYKYLPQGNDNGELVIVLSKWNTTLGKRDTLGFGNLLITSQMSSWTAFDIPVDYWNASATPDSITLLCVSSAGYNMTDLQGAVGVADSELYLDVLSIQMEAGINQIKVPESEVNIFPNPASYIITFESVHNNTLLDLEIYNVSGKRLVKYSRFGKQKDVDISGYSDGVYYYILSEGGLPVYSGKFVVMN